MYRVMIIDDEPTARKLLISSVDWEKYNMEIVGEAANGIEAINVIDDMRPDLAFVDISMPFMNGIEFTNLATKRYVNLKIIILTAFDEFEYARQCIGLPVLDYILKPITREEIGEAVANAKTKLDELVHTEDDEAFEDDNSEIESSSIEMIKNYIRSNYTDSTLNLTSVSMQFGFNTSYLSRKFKQETGKSFVTFLTECRMEKAIELALKNEKMFFTANQVGIPDPNYFSRCFKKYTGVSYSEYGKNTK